MQVTHGAARASRTRSAAGSATGTTRCWCRVRSGAKFSMPGMMETVLNIGLNDATVHGLAEVVRRRAVRLGLLPPADADVRQDRARHRRRAVRRRAGRGEGATGASPSDVDLDADDLDDAGRVVQGDRAGALRADVPAAPARAAGPGDPRGLRLVEHRPGPAVPAPRADPARPRHRGQRLHDGVRQPRRDLRHRRVLHPRPGHRASRARTATTWPTRRARTSSPASATP